MALQVRPLAQPGCSDVPFGTQTNESEAVPGLRHAGGRIGNKMPSMWRKHDVLFCRGQQDPGTMDATNLSGDVRDAHDLLPDVWTGNCNHAEAWGWRTEWRLDGFRW